MSLTTSVVIATRDRRGRLEAVLEPLLADPATSEVVAVVDASQDGSHELLRARAQQDPRLTVIGTDRRVRQARARALGVEAARGEVILSVDDDVIAAPGLVSGHAAHHAAADGLVVLGYMPVALDARRRPGDFAVRDYAASYERTCDSYEADPEQVLLHFWGGNFSVRRADYLAAIEGYDFPLKRHEDRGLGFVLADAGLTGVFDRRLRATHHQQRDFAGWVQDGFWNGAAAVELHRRYGDRIGGFSPDVALRAYSRPARVIVGASDRARVRRVSLRLLEIGVRASGHARAWGLERRLAMIARHVGERDGALTAGRTRSP